MKASSLKLRSFRFLFHSRRVRTTVFVFLTVLCARFLLTHKKSEKYLWLTPRLGGFNNQLITIYEALNCARIHGRIPVLPLMYENGRQDTSMEGWGPYPFEDYFDMSAAHSFLRGTTPAELDIVGLPCQTIYFSTCTHFKASAYRIPRLLQQQYAYRYSVLLKFLPVFNYPVKYTCVDDSMCRRIDAKALGEYSVYEEAGQGYNIRKSPILQELRAILKPSFVITEIANMVVQLLPTLFNAVHIRRGDFSSKCAELPQICRRFGNSSMIQSGEDIAQKIEEFQSPDLPLFVATTHPGECRRLLQKLEVQLFFMEDFALPPHVQWAKSRTDILSFAEQVIASHAEQFIGNRFSSFSTEIKNLRYLRNESDTLNFF